MNLKALTICLGSVALALAAAGCSKGQQCTPTASECAGTRAVLVCPSDGSAWSTYSCQSWETCSAGLCKAVDGIDVACTPGAAKCVNDRVLSVCVAANTAPSIVACQENETCKDGVCLSPAACTAAATECVNATLMRTCSADGKSWVASACAPTETCDATLGACARRTDVFCTSANNECVNGVPFVCKKDGSGFDTTACAANTHCVGDGRCQGNSATGCVVGTSCSGDTVVSCSSDGKTSTYTQCAVGHSCLVDPTTRLASCKQVICEPGSRQCGNPADPAAAAGAFVSTCKADGSGWMVARCEANSICTSGACQFDCLPGATACSDNSVVTCSAQGQWDLASVTNCGEGRWCVDHRDPPAHCEDYLCAISAHPGVCQDVNHFLPCKEGVLQPAIACPGGCGSNICHDSCVDGETRCSEASGGPKAKWSYAVETCKDGRWLGTDPAAVACNDPLSGGLDLKVCVPLSELPGAHKAVCGDPECTGYLGQTCTLDGKVRQCTDGILGAAQDCPAGTSCHDPYLGCWLNVCEASESRCVGTLGYVGCENGNWSDTYTSCGRTLTGTFKNCMDVLDSDRRQTGQCYDPAQCPPGAKRCSLDTLGVETCQADGTWGTATACTLGTCTGADATCTAQCKPGEMICGGAWTTVYGQSATTKTAKCSASGRLPDWTTILDCAAGTSCRIDLGGSALGCVECQGSRTETGFVDTRCAGDPLAGQTEVQFCGDGNTWASGAAMTIDCGAMFCLAASNSAPAQCVSWDK